MNDEVERTGKEDVMACPTFLLIFNLCSHPRMPPEAKLMSVFGKQQLQCINQPVYGTDRRLTLYCFKSLFG
jgi:hypothetical protein